MGEDAEAGDNANETLGCNYNGRNIVIGFNCKYIEQALQNLHDYADTANAVMSFSEPSRPVLIYPEIENADILMLIMPVRV